MSIDNDKSEQRINDEESTSPIHESAEDVSEQEVEELIHKLRKEAITQCRKGFIRVLDPSMRRVAHQEALLALLQQVAYPSSASELDNERTYRYLAYAVTPDGNATASGLIAALMQVAARIVADQVIEGKEEEAKQQAVKRMRNAMEDAFAHKQKEKLEKAEMPENGMN